MSINFSDLRHKNIYLSSFIALVIIVVGVFYNYAPSFFAKQEPNKKTVIAISESSTNRELGNRDTDRDGLPDWEEYLYNASPTSADSDGDGTNDGDEVKAGRNPIIANTAKAGEEPNDKLAKIQDVNFSTSTTGIDPTQREFLKKYLEQAGKDIRETTYRDLLSKFDAAKFTPDQQLVDLNISSDNTNEGMRAFINAFGTLILKYKTPGAPPSETHIFDDFSKTQDPNTLKALDLTVIEYNNFVKDLRRIAVPSGMAKTYLSIVEGYEGMALGLKGLQQMKEDPINGSGGYESYVSYRVQVANGFAVIVKELSDRKIVFTQDEPGFMFYANVFGSQS